MIPCIVLGDSIAVGVGQNRPECYTAARVGITSAAYLQDMLPWAQVNAETAIVSLGVNDDPSAATYENLRSLRASLRVKQVYWVVPYSRDYARLAVQQVAQLYGDRMLDLRDYSGYMARDRVHPTGYGYQTIAARLGAGGEPDYRTAAQYRYDQPVVIPLERDPAAWAAAQNAYPSTAVSREPAWTRQAWARHAIARQELAREAWGRTLSHRTLRPLPVVARTVTFRDGRSVTVHEGLPTPPVPPVVGRIENGHLTVYRTFHDWKAAHKG